ncbi:MULTISPECIES: hypothetical protein [unclassified Burkholderia]|uniref:hypothetical protein n=1 Tax=unclassified Burkholderia TaxID=2613784 RepID=UPI002AAF3C91|nr:MULTISPECIES: hypothetical protein [unclassified Burkholderia]
MNDHINANNNYRINACEMSIARGPFSYELIRTRQTGRWRLQDSNDNAVGSAEDEAAAIEAVRVLNACNL